MLHPLRRVAAPFALSLLLTLGACGGGGQASSPTATPAPTEAPTRTPRPTRERAPTVEILPTEVPAPTEVVLDNGGDGELQTVEIGNLQTYAHSSGVFQIDIPENWELQDTSNPDELIMIWTDPTRNGAVIVDIFESDAVYSAEDLTTVLQEYLKKSFGSQPDFYYEEPTTQADDSILIVWTYTATADNGVEATLLGNTFIEQRGNKVSLLSTLVPQAQFDALIDSTNEIINTYRIDPDASIS